MSIQTLNFATKRNPIGKAISLANSAVDSGAVVGDALFSFCNAGASCINAAANRLQTFGDIENIVLEINKKLEVRPSSFSKLTARLDNCNAALSNFSSVSSNPLFSKQEIETIKKYLAELTNTITVFTNSVKEGIDELAEMAVEKPQGITDPEIEQEIKSVSDTIKAEYTRVKAKVDLIDAKIYKAQKNKESKYEAPAMAILDSKAGEDTTQTQTTTQNTNPNAFKTW